jgi:hypothetical protein
VDRDYNRLNQETQEQEQETLEYRQQKLDRLLQKTRLRDPYDPFLKQAEELQTELEDMNRRFGQQARPNQRANTHRQQTARPQRAQPTNPLQRQPNDLTYSYGEDPFPPHAHAITKAVRFLDEEHTPIHLFFILDRNTAPEASRLRHQASERAKKRREQVGGDLFEVANAALTSNRPALVKVWDTKQGELYVTSVGREDLASVMYGVAPDVWRVAGVGTGFCEGRVYLLRNAKVGGK